MYALGVWVCFAVISNISYYLLVMMVLLVIGISLNEGACAGELRSRTCNFYAFSDICLH